MKTQIQTCSGLAVALAGEGRGRGSSVACRVSRDRCRGAALASLLAMATILAPRAWALVTASGGNYTNDIGGYRIHVFTNSATASNFVVSAASSGDTVEVLVVGGGGAGGGVNNGGGGGAGGFIYSNGYSVVAGSNYTVTVGVGGPANSGTTPVAGSNSVFGTITATGGGGGGGGNAGQGGGVGGSGGGGAWSSGPKGTRTPSPIQGNDGAAGVNGGNYPGGGGGGAGAPASGAQGGSGTNCAITSLDVWYAGGGSGGRSSTVLTGGSGGGGNGGGNSPGTTAPTAGQPGTGGGGGGCQSSSTTGASGGSGIVIVRYFAPGITLQPVANLTTNSANLIATLNGTNADLYAYWDTQDRGTNFTWAYTNSPLTAFANTAAGTTITNTVTGLTPGTSYAYRFYGTNTTSGWSGWSSAGSFITPGPPIVDNTNGVTGLGVGTATLNGRVTSTNGAVCYGKLFWGPADGSNNPTAWVYTNDISGAVTQGVAYAVTLSNLLYGQQYYYRAAASNSYGLAWATNSVGFVTAMPPGPRIVPLVRQPVAWYRFDSSANFGLDSSANGFNMTVYNSPVAAADAKFSGAVAWSNTLSQYMQLTGSAWTSLQNKLTNTTGQTVVMWVKKGALQHGNECGGLMRGLGAGNNDHYTYLSVAYLMGFAGTRMDGISTPPAALRETWHMLAMVRDPNDSSTGRRVYFLTNAVATAERTAAPGTLTWGADFTIGLNGSPLYFGGAMDDFMLFDKALSTAELSTLYSDAGTYLPGNSISNLTASGGTSTSAVLNATLQGTGSVFTVSAYYWVAGAGSSNVVAVGTFTNAASTNLSVTATNLTPGMNYAYTFLASNAATNLWATPAVSFITGDVNVQATDPTGRVTLADTAAFTVYRPAAATNGDLTVNYTLGGTATNGVNYTNSPAASGTNGTVTILAGQTNAVVTVYPLNVLAPQQTVVLTLASGGYVIGSANSATCTLAAVTGYTYNDIASANWNATSTWTPTGYPGTNDAAVIDSHTVSLTNSLSAGTNAPASITVSIGGTLQAGTDNATYSIDSPVTLGGGMVNLPASRTLNLNGPVTLQNTSTARVESTTCTINGPISGSGKLVTWFRYWQGGLALANANSTNWTGSLDVRPGDAAGSVGVTTNGGLGRATANVYQGFNLNVSQSYGANPKPTINVYPNGTIYLQDGAGSKSISSDIPVFMRGGAWSTTTASGQWYNNCTQSGPVTLVSNTVVGCSDYGVVWNFTGPIDGPGQFILQSPNAGYGAGTTYLSGTNTYTGGTWVQSGLLVAKNTNAFGSGSVQVDYYSGAASHGVVQLAATTPSANYWTLTNNLAGDGTFKVEDGSANYRLTEAGAVSPGTNAGAAVAVLTVTGKFAFAKSAGGVPATLAIDVASAGTVAGTNYDQLLVSTGDVALASSITNCTLALSRVPMPTQMNGLTLTILSAPGANFSPYTFASVTGLGSGGSVSYGNGSITLTWVAQTPIINNGAYSNLAATSCDVSGYLSSTGDSPTVVRCYWGTNAMDKSGWGYTNTIGTQAIGTVWTSLTNLTSTVTYYYRFYATNDAGEYWSVATSNFTTLGDVNWNDVANGNWNADNANTWGLGTGIYPYRLLNDHVTIDSHTVTLMNSLTAGSTAPADITLATNGILQPGTDWTTYSVDSPVTINGGTVYSPGLRGLAFNGPVTMLSTSTVNIGYQDSCTFRGPMSGTGKLIASLRHWNAAGTALGGANSTNWTGTLEVSGSGTPVGVTTNGGLGLATANVYAGFNLGTSQSYGSNPKPTINVYPNGMIQFTAGGNNTIASDIPVFMRGGAWSTTTSAGQPYNNCTQSGPVTLVSNTVVGCSDYGVVWNFSGPIDGPGQFILQSPGASYGAGTTYLGGNNTYAGGTWVQSGLLVAKNTNSFGSGPVQVDYNTNAASHGVIQLAATTPSSNYWVLANNLVGGCGTNVALQVENGASTNTLTLLGTLDPGTNGTAVTTNSTGIFRVDGSVAFGAGSRLKIHIADTNGVAGVDFDRLLVDHDLTGLGNATLEVAVSSSLTPEMLNGLSFVVVSNATALASTFGSVVWSGPWQGKVVYNQPTGTVKLTGSDLGSVYKFR